MKKKFNRFRFDRIMVVVCRWHSMCVLTWAAAARRCRLFSSTCRNVRFGGSRTRCFRSVYFHAYTHAQRPFVQDCPGGPVPEETFIHSHPSWSSDILFHFPPSTTILFVQFACLTVLFDNLSPDPRWSSSWSWTLYFILHAFFQPIMILFSQHMPIPSQTVLL